MSERLRVALLIESSRSYGRQLLKGIAAYARMHGSWTFFHQERALGDPIPPRLKNWKPDGIIARFVGAKLTRQICRMRVPAVDLYPEDKTEGIPGVASDPELLVRMAVDHFRERGFSNFAYCGFSNVPFSDLRAACYVEHLAQRGLQGSVFSYPAMRRATGLASIEAHAMQYADKLVDWLRGLPKPLALLACNDVRGQQVLSICGEAGIAVPDQVAVLGIDNDDVLCELCDPPLSSIDPNVEQIGYQGAALLDRMMQGEIPSPARVLAPAMGVVVRCSTDVLAIENGDAAEAIRFVRQRACDGISIEEVMGRVSVSRSTLERWFDRYLGRSPTVEITRIQVQRVQELLRTTNLTLEEIAQATGFAHVESMQRIFKRMVGLTPGRYRKRDDKGY
jgi:LacI family transcriptional regulator